MKANYKFIVFLVLAIVLGLIIAWIDSGPNWDDSGITAALIVFVSGIISMFYPSRPLVWGFAVSAWIPIYGIIKTGNFSLLFILLFGLGGAFLGSFIHKLIFKKN